MKRNFESLGYRVIVKDTIDPHFKTSTFILKPDGTTVGYYDHLYEIPMDLYEGEEVSCPVTEFPLPAQNTQSHELHAEGYSVGEGGMVVWFLIGLIFVGIVIGILFMKAFFANEFKPPPCGERGSVIDITECVKEIIYPDCSGVMYDACTREIIDKFEPPEEKPEWGWLQWAIVGVVVVGGTYIAVKVLPGILKKGE